MATGTREQPLTKWSGGILPGQFCKCSRCGLIAAAGEESFLARRPGEPIFCAACSRLNPGAAEAFRPGSQRVRAVLETARSMGFAKASDDFEKQTKAALEIGIKVSPIDVMKGDNTDCHLARLALLSLDRLVVHQIRPAVTRLVAETDLHSFPGVAPRLMRRPFLIEVRRPETGERLFGQTVWLAGFRFEGKQHIIGMDYPEQGYLSSWNESWRDEDIASIASAPEAIEFIDNVGEYREWARQAARFLVVFSLLLEAESAPITVKEDRDAISAQRGGKQSPTAWITRHIRLNEPPRRGTQAAADSSAPDASGRQSVDVLVRGHIKRQRFGPRNQKVKWIYVSSFEARRWVAPGPSILVVDAGDEDRG